MTPEEVAREIAGENGTLWDKTISGCIELIAKALREYGEAEYLRGIQHHFETCDKREKKADAEGYRRGVSQRGV